MHRHTKIYSNGKIDSTKAFGAIERKLPSQIRRATLVYREKIN